MKSFIIFALITLSQARFDQEQIPIEAIRQVQGGAPGVADTIAGAAISDLLAAADPCAKLSRGDQILSELGTGKDAVAAAIGMVAAEKNFNSFTTSQPSICGDASLPQNALLRGITPKIDPAVGGADVANALSAQTVSKPLQADGKSIADLLSENGFMNFTTSGASASPAQPSGKVNEKSAADGPAAAPGNGTAPPPPASMPIAPVAVSASAEASGSMTPPSPAPPSPPAMSAPPPPPLASPPGSPANAVGNVSAGVSVVTPPAPPACTCTCGAMAANAANANANSTAAAAGAAKKHHKGKQGGAAAMDGSSAANNVTASAGNDFGSCDPTMSFKAGRPGRKATEFTFQSNDPVIAANQQDALNPNIITNRICDELTNICNANSAAKATCLSAKAKILALGTKDQSTADAWNALVGGATARMRRRRVTETHARHFRRSA